MALSPFDGDELSKILELINHLTENALDNDSHSTCIIARFMHYFYRAKFFNFCGLPCTRLEADKSVYEEDRNFHALTSSVSWALDAMLFWTPQSHLEDLRKVWVDECVNTPRWKDFNKNLMTEWTGITIYSTVMLAVDVSFLGVPNVNISLSQSIGIIATYLSIIFITGSLIVSVLLVRQNQRYGFESADKATHFLSHMTGTFFGVRVLPTVQSSLRNAYVGDDILCNSHSVQCVQVYESGHASVSCQRVRGRYCVHFLVHLGCKVLSCRTTGKVHFTQVLAGVTRS